MEFTELEIEIFDSLISGDPEEGVLREQISSAKVIDRDFTGVGVFTKVSVSDDAPLLSASNRYIETTPKTYLEHPSLEAEAGVILWFENYKISTLECYTFDGDWPEDETLFKIIT